ncbi:MAG: radical SAM protein [Polyangiales bacterium]
MEPDRQFEIQLGHMCNNRCVFCVSGQRTAQREAFPIEGSEVIERLREGRAQGLRKVTLLGGEPTLQPDFLDVVRAAVELGFDEVVVFTNGVKTARGEFVDEVLATGGRFTWRLSFQGATALAHERTTKKLGSFQRLSQTLANLRERGQRTTVNMCVVRSNYASVTAFPDLVLKHGVVQLHLDMIRPLDAGVRTEDEMRAMLPRYSDMVPALTEMVEVFEARAPGFDVNIGNLPYCVAPALAPWIHHDGETTFTVAVDDRDQLSAAWDKYQVKRRDKLKPSRCAACVFDAQCSGVFETYERFYGLDELQPVTPERLAVLDPAQRLFTLHAKPFVERLKGWSPPPPFAAPAVHEDSREGAYTLRFDGVGGAFAVVALRRGGRGAGGAAATDRFSLHLVDASDGGAAVALLRALLDRLCDGGGATVLHGVDADAAFHAPRGRALSPTLDWRIGQCLARLRSRAPFGTLTWRGVSLDAQGRGAAVELDTDDGNTVTVSFAVKGASVSGGYRLRRPVERPSEDLVASVRGVMEALRAS